MGTATEQYIKTEVLPEEDNDISEFDGKSHYVRVNSLIKGGAQVALCGKKWIPKTIAEADNYPLCKTCDDLFGIMKATNG